MARKAQTSFTPEAEIRALEQLSDEEVALTGAQVKRLLRSYRLAANVANAAWFLVQSVPEVLEGVGIDRSVYNERAIRLVTALNDYAPEHFPRLPPRVVDALEELYDEVAQQSDNLPPGFLDWFFEMIQSCRKA